MENLKELCEQFKPENYLILQEIIDSPSKVNRLFKDKQVLIRRGIKKIDLKNWIKKSNSEITLIYVVYKDPDDFIRNDNWGGFILYKLAIIKVTDERTDVLSKSITTFD